MRFVFVGAFAVAVTSILAQAPSAAQTGTLKNAIGMEFVKIPAGEFMMGCSTGDTACKDAEKPQHRVRITKAFEMGKYEVTQAQWKAVMNANESVFVGDNNPVEMVTRAEAIDFAKRLFDFFQRVASDDGNDYAEVHDCLLAGFPFDS